MVTYCRGIKKYLIEESSAIVMPVSSIKLIVCNKFNMCSNNL